MSWRYICSYGQVGSSIETANPRASQPEHHTSSSSERSLARSYNVNEVNRDSLNTAPVRLMTTTVPPQCCGLQFKRLETFSFALRITSGVAAAYLAVIDMLECPIARLMIAMSTPKPNAQVA